MNLDHLLDVFCLFVDFASLNHTIQMGICNSQEDKQNHQISKAIDKKLKESHAQEEKVIKLLLLGAGECGKTIKSVFY